MGQLEVAIIATDTKGLITVFNTGAEHHVRLCRRGNDRAADPSRDHLEAEINAQWAGVDAGAGPPHRRHGRFQ